MFGQLASGTMNKLCPQIMSVCNWKYIYVYVRPLIRIPIVNTSLIIVNRCVINRNLPFSTAVKCAHNHKNYHLQLLSPKYPNNFRTWAPLISSYIKDIFKLSTTKTLIGRFHITCLPSLYSAGRLICSEATMCLTRASRLSPVCWYTLDRIIRWLSYWVWYT